MLLLDYDDLRAKGIKLNRVTIWRLVRADRFPKPIKVGGLRNCWVEKEIDAYIESRIASRDDALTETQTQT
jgi:predicted DNA-binding transcriptional regulator AlpA